MRSLLWLPALTLLAGLAGASSAEARTAVPTTNVNVRSGPGTSYGVVGVLPAGAHVWVGTCTGDWCSVKLGSLAGWSNATYLAATYRPPVVIAPPPIIIRPPHFHRPPGWRPGHGPGHRPRPPHHKPPMCKIAPGHPCK